MMFPETFFEALVDIIEYRFICKIEHDCPGCAHSSDHHDCLMTKTQAFDIIFEEIWKNFDVKTYSNICVQDNKYDPAFYLNLKTLVKDALVVRI